MNYAIVTGASKGLGEAVADHLIDHSYHIIDVSRSGNQRLQQKAEQNELTYDHAQIDLRSPDQAASFLTSWFDKITQIPPEKVMIVHNAGTVEPIEKVGNLDNELVDQAVHLNYITPVVLTNIAFKRSNELDISLTVVNITSGAAEKPNHGWSVYGSTKAALNLFTETAALEQVEQGSKNTIISFSPSIMDTEMQEVIRSSSASAFSQVERFQEFKKDGKLRKPDEVGGALVRLLMEDQIESGKLYHINDLLH
ncbi:(S)-benzoin forming benzil reductase [Jeotgalibacillus sp. S-D1]|uniref:(S)-benzoin forming benzil reductase n=1 Tax=Jeotgalibacillus sp. S-D1 TaxID=2552189 RepID=UPI00105A5A3C|nr:(S)-benzoin forming benzil reductase [Jeotgalibacillus sp. S-D1]TDL30456.1 (S)-benzoin forming benzil reductase [Jeotgalibacillus sp. S-D1]